MELRGRLIARGARAETIAETPIPTDSGGNEIPFDGDLDGKTDSRGQKAASPRVIFAICASALLMASLDATIVATALHRITHDLHSSLNWASWTITVYSLGQLLAMPLAGKVADHFGRRRIFLCSIALFTAASLCCAFSTSMYMLASLRFIQAAGGGALMPVSSGIISDSFQRDRDRALGMFTSIFPIGGMIGPLLGGLFVAYWSWRGIFLINVPFGILIVFLAMRCIPESRARTHAKLDLPGVGLVALVILGAILGVAVLGNAGTNLWNPFVIASELVAVAASIAFVRHIRRSAQPFIPIQLLYGKGFACTNMLNVLFGACAFGISTLVPVYAMDRYHLSALAAGTLLSARSLGMILIAGIATMLLRRTGSRAPMILGSWLIAGGLLLMAKAPIGGLTNYLWLSLAAGIYGIGSGTLSPAANNACMQLAPTQVASVAGLRGMFRQAGGIIAISVTSSIVARSSTPGLAQAHIYIAFAVLLVLAAIPVRLFIPDTRGQW